MGGFAVFAGPAALPAGDEHAVVDRAIRGADATPQWVEDEFIVVIGREARGNLDFRVNAAGRPTVNQADLQDVFDRNGVVRFARQFPTARPQDINAPFPDLTGHYKAQLARGIPLDAAVNAFAQHPAVDHVEKIGIHPVYSCGTGTPTTPNDTYYNNPPPTFNFPQWDLWDANGIDADLAWTVEAGDPSVVVVDADTGVRYFHADLGGTNPPGPGDNSTNGNMWVNPFEIPGNGIDDEGNGKIDDVVGWDFVTNPSLCASGEDCTTADNDPRDHNGHGTHTSGTMAAITNNARGVAGVAGGFGDGTTGSAGNGAKVMALRIGWTNISGGGNVRMDWAAEAMNYAADMKQRGVNVVGINCSWGSSNSGGLDAAVNNALANDIMVVHAAGNGNTSTADFLGAKAGVLNVAATDQSGLRASFSNFGSWVDIAAPGVDIVSTYHNNADPANDYVAASDGTSMSAPHCVGVAALLESCNPSLTGPQKFTLMVNNTCPAGSPNIGGILNAKKALDAAGCGGAPQCQTNADCDDTNACTTDTCSGGVCSNTPITCNDGSACTSDSCNPASGCVFTPVDCNDGDGCTTDSCNPASGCVNTPAACGPADGCCSSGCSSANDPDCPSCAPIGAPCASNADCCSNKCRGRGGNKTCR